MVLVIAGGTVSVEKGRFVDDAEEEFERSLKSMNHSVDRRVVKLAM